MEFYPYYNKWMSVCIMQQYISETWPPILMKLGMKFTHIPTMVRGKFHLISPINKNFIGKYRDKMRYSSNECPCEIFVYGWNQMKLSTNHGGNMGELHAKFHQNWWSGFRDIVLQRHFLQKDLWSLSLEQKKSVNSRTNNPGQFTKMVDRLRKTDTFVNKL